MATETVGEGLRAFCEAWNQGKISAAMRMAGMLQNKTVNCQVQGGPCYTLSVTSENAALREGPDGSAHATLAMSEADWLGVLSGRYSVWSVQLAGRQYSPLHEQALCRQLGLILQSFALGKAGPSGGRGG